MHRIDGPGATVDHKFTEGDPATATQATTVTDDWLNAIQEEIAGVIESADITLSKSSNGQLLAAITSKIAAAIPANVPQGLRGAFSKLRLSATGANALVSVMADELTVANSSGAYRTLQAINISINSANVGVNAFDAGVLPASAWCSVWVIWNGTTAAGLLSLSDTAPTMPAGYTHKARVGWVRTDATANKYPLAFIQAGKDVQYTPKASGNVLRFPAMSTGASIGNSAVAGGAVAVSTLGVVPPTASRIRMNFTQTGSGSANGIIVPSNNYGFDGSPMAPPIGLTISGEQGQQPPIEFMLETSDIYMSCGSAYTLSCIGWRDSL